jgi:acetyltransferase-like isoleucine patch superfamily enzyme
MNTIASTAVVSKDTIIGDNVVIGENVFIDHGCIIRDNVRIGNGSRIGAMCILGEYLASFYDKLENTNGLLSIGNNALIRSGTIIYGDTIIGDNFQTGHRVTIREKTKIGNNVRVGTLSDIQGHCDIGSYVSMHSNVHIGQESVIKDYVWIFPYVVLTNDPTTPSEEMMGVTIEKFAVIATGSILLPGVHIGKDALVGAGSIVTKDVEAETIVVGNPAKNVGNITKIRNKINGEQVYPWRYSFSRGMPWAKNGYKEWEKSEGLL